MPGSCLSLTRAHAFVIAPRGSIHGMVALVLYVQLYEYRDGPKRVSPQRPDRTHLGHETGFEACVFFRCLGLQDAQREAIGQRARPWLLRDERLVGACDAG